GDDTFNGTGKDDIYHEVSGNENIHGGSGSDTINGNNGSHAIIGGNGGDRPTGGNGDNIFVHLAVANSTSGEPDNIADLVSRSDRIDLAALGALAFLALSPESTSVPPHTLAWIYDSASNETIIYVNATDQTLSIGDTALLEIHLQGVASVQETDFIFEHATAPVVAAADTIDPALAAAATADGTVLTAVSAGISADLTDSGHAHATHGDWALPAAEDSFSFHFAHDRVDSTDSARSSHFGDIPAYTTEGSYGDAVITLASASPNEPQHDHHNMAPAADHFTFDHE